MAKNERFRNGNKLSLPVPSGTTAGSPVRLGQAATGLNGVTETDRAATTGQTPYNADGTPNTSYNYGGGNPDGNATVWLDGVHNLAIGTTTAMAALDPVYITSGNALTPSSSGNQLFGHILEAKGTTAGEVHPVRIAN